MADRRTRRAEARRKRHKDRRDQAKRRRKGSGDAGLADAARWPFREAWIGEDWHDGVSEVPAFGLRQHDDGRCAWMIVRVDMADGTLLEAEAHLGTENEARVALTTLAEAATLIETTPPGLAHLVAEARDRTDDEVDGLGDVLRILGDTDPELSPLPLRFGFDTPTDPGPAAREPGLTTRLFRRIFGRSSDS